MPTQKKVKISMPTQNFENQNFENQKLNSSSLLVTKTFLDEMAFKTLPKMAFEVEFHSKEWQQMPVSWCALAIGYLIGQGKTSQQAVEIVKKIFDYANEQSHDHWSRQQYSLPGLDPNNEAISLRGVGVI